MVGVIKTSTKKYLMDRGIHIDWFYNSLSRDRRIQSSNVLNEPYIINITKHPISFTYSRSDPKKHTLDAVLRKIENKDNFINHLPWLKDEDYYGVPNIGAVFYQTKPSKEALRPYGQVNIKPPPHLGVGVSNLGLNQMWDIFQHYSKPRREITSHITTYVLESWLRLDERRTEWKPEWTDYQYQVQGNTRFINWPLVPPRIE